ncbi:MAG: hypothetical protein GY720_10590 [bacterium]|nr:hypothetical protein [bacterium]MCP5030645.1 hypothetical protein [Actinomycetes bacterium]
MGGAPAADGLAEMKELFIIEAAKYNVFPIDDRTGERFNATIAGRPELQSGRPTQGFGQGMSLRTENTVLNVKNRSHVISAQLRIPDGGASGVLIAQGGRFSGWALYVIGGRLGYSHNWFSSEIYAVSAPNPLPGGDVSVQHQFDLDGGHPGAAGTGALLGNGEAVAEGRIEKTVPFVFFADETMDIGRDTASPVIDDYGPGAEKVFTG